MKNKIFKKLCAVVFVFCLLTGVAVAAEDTIIPVPGGQEIGTDYFNVGDKIAEGRNVKGDVILAGSDVSFSGNADGDIILAGSDASVKGNSAGDVRIVGGKIILAGNVGKNVTVVGSNVVIEKDSVIQGNLYVAGGKVELRGEVRGNAKVSSSQLIFSGKVGGNADFRASDLSFDKDASIAGNFTYASSADIAIAGEAVRGSVTKVPMENPTDNYTRNEAATAGVVIWQFLSLLVIMLILSKFFAKQVKALTVPITEKEIWGRIASGFIWFVLNPIVILVAVLTVIGFPLALLLLFFYVVLIICALAITPVILGRLANSRLKLYAEKEKGLWKDFILGYAVMQFVGLIPVLGDLALVLLFLFAFGRVTKYALTAVKGNK